MAGFGSLRHPPRGLERDERLERRTGTSSQNYLVSFRVGGDALSTGADGRASPGGSELQDLAGEPQSQLHELCIALPCLYRASRRDMESQLIVRSPRLVLHLLSRAVNLGQGRLCGRRLPLLALRGSIRCLAMARGRRPCTRWAAITRRKVKE